MGLMAPGTPAAPPAKPSDRAGPEPPNRGPDKFWATIDHRYGPIVPPSLLIENPPLPSDISCNT